MILNCRYFNKNFAFLSILFFKFQNNIISSFNYTHNLNNMEKENSYNDWKFHINER